MSLGSKAVTVVALLMLGVAGTEWWVHHVRTRTITLRGAVITQNADPRKQLPISGVQITASDGISTVQTTSDASGAFTVVLPKRLFRGRPVTLRFLHMDYRPLAMNVWASNTMYVADMVPVQSYKALEESIAQETISNVVVRYSIKTATVVNIGSTVRTFEVANTGNVPCKERPPCSPDGTWKAAMGSIALDAGVGNAFRNTRASCIAGPCPFTRIDTSDQQDGRTFTVTATVWSDTATFLVEAEIVHPMISDLVRNSYPVTFGEALNFTLPPAAEGVSLQADLNGESIVFPLGPALILSWADCSARSNPDQTRVYSCELKPGYRWLRPAT